MQPFVQTIGEYWQALGRRFLWRWLQGPMFDHLKHLAEEIALILHAGDLPQS